MAFKKDFLEQQGMSGFTREQLAVVESMISQGASNEDIGQRVSDYKTSNKTNEMALEQSNKSQNKQGLIQSGLQGLSLGFIDEAMAALEAPFNRQEGEGLGDAYRRRQQELDAYQRQYAKENPWKSFGAEMIGAAGPAGVGAAAYKMMSNIPKVTKLGGIGAAEGAIYGAGQADPGEAASGAVTGGLFGAVTAPAASKLTEVIAKLGGATGGWIARKLSETDEKTARRLLQRYGVDYDRRTPDEIADALEKLGPEGLLADVSPNLQGAARGVAASPGHARNIAEDALKPRQAGMQDRVISKAGDELGGLLGSDPTDIGRMQALVKEARSSQASPYYDRAYDTVFRPTGVLADIMNTDAGKKAYKMALKKASDERINLEPDKMVRVLDYMKRSFDDMIGKAKRGGLNDRVRVLSGLKNDLVTELDDQVPDYKTARGIYAKGSALSDAGGLGEDIFKYKPDEIEDLTKNLGESERIMYRLGVIKAVRDKVELTGESHNAVNRLINSTGTKRKIKTAFDSDESFDEFMDTLSNENTMRETLDKALGGSHTARIEAELADMNKSADVEGALALFDPSLGVAREIGKMVKKNGATPEVLEEMAKVLFARNMTREEIVRIFTKSGLTLPPSLQNLSSKVGTGVGLLSVLATQAAATPLTEGGLLQ